MKKLFLLGVLSLMIYSCQKQTIAPIEVSNKSTQSACAWDGIYVADSAATAYTCAQTNLVDTLANISAEIIYLGDSVYSTGQVACKYDLDNITKSISYLDPTYVAIAFRVNAVPSYKTDTIILKTRSNKYFALVKQ